MMQDQGVLGRAFEDEDVARDDTERPERDKRWWSGN